MAILGEIIKSAIELADKYIPVKDPKDAQIKVLKELLEKAEQTSFGQHYKFSTIRESVDIRKAFSDNLPFFDYARLREGWWQRVIDGQENITWPGKVTYFAVSSGTTSAKKHIPVTDDMLESIRRAGLLQIKGIADFDLPSNFFEKEILMFGSTTDLKEVNGHFEGEISGISAAQIPFWFKGFYRPGDEISAIADWDDRVEAIAKVAREWDIGAISGIPSWIEIMLKKVIAYHNVDSIHDIWPNFSVFTSGGVAFESYRKSFEAICSKPITVIDTYLASEGYLATQVRKDTDAMALFVDNGIYYEFVPFEPEFMNPDGSVKQNAPVVSIEDVEEDKDYVLIISTVSGAWRYMIGDTIRFKDKSRMEIKITGRTKHFLNVVGSHLSVIQMNKAMAELEEEFDCDIKEFAVGALKIDDEYTHQWFIGIGNDNFPDSKDFSDRLDSILKNANKNYGVARSKALKSIEVTFIKSRMFTEWVEKTKQKGGQVKVPKVLQVSDLENFMTFIEGKD